MMGRQVDPSMFPVKFVLGNKRDIKGAQHLDKEKLMWLQAEGIEIKEVSALTNRNVQEAFE